MDDAGGAGQGPWAAGAALREACEVIEGIDTADVSAFAARVRDAKVVVLGGAVAGASEPTRWRARLTRELLGRHGFTFLATTADWADAAHVDRQLRLRPREARPWRAFTAGDAWPWRTWEVLDFLEWMRAHDAETRSPLRRAGLFGLDVLGEGAALELLAASLGGVDPAAGARLRRGWGAPSPAPEPLDAETRAALRDVEGPWLQRLEALLAERLESARHEGERFLDAVEPGPARAALGPWAQAVLSAPLTAWSLRAQHLADTLHALLAAGGARARAVVWADDALAGDSAATSAGAAGARSLGHLLRQRYGARAWLVGFGAGRGSLLAAPTWGAAPERRLLEGPSLFPAAPPGDGAAAAFMLPLRDAPPAVREALATPRPQRWWGPVGPACVVEGSLAGQFDELAWFDEVRPVAPLTAQHAGAWPFSSPPPPPLEPLPTRAARRGR